jgi:hypothetical protein
MLVFNLPLDPDTLNPSDFIVDGHAVHGTFWTANFRNRLFITSEFPFETPVNIALVGQIAGRNGSVLEDLDGIVPPAPTATPTPLVFTPTPIVIPKEAVFFEGHYYLVVDFAVPWGEAAMISEDENGHLVTISNARESLFVTNLVEEQGVGGYWIGLSDHVSEGEFLWITGEPMTFQAWASGEPNNEGNEDFVEAGFGAFGGIWNDLAEDGTGGGLPFVIEFDEFGGKPPTNVPTPTPTKTPQEPPNLVPAHPSQWDGPLVTSAVTSSFLDVPPPLEDNFTVGQEIYVHWAITNDSPVAVTEPFVVGIKVDGRLEMRFVVPRLDSRAVHSELNQPLVINEAGEHEIELVIDAEQRIPESNDFDNSFPIYPRWQSRPDIVFVSDRDGNDEIYTMAEDGTGQTRLTFEPSFDGYPAFSPDGTQIAFESERDGNNEIYLMDANGSNQRNLTHNSGLDSAPSWSPDGSQLTFVSKRDGGQFEIYVMKSDGSGAVRLTKNSAVDDFPSWSADGSRIIFQSSRDGDNEIYSINPDGSGLSKETNNFIADLHPRPSPDGSKIAFVSDRDGNNEIYIRNIGATASATPVAKRLTFHDGNDFWPSWSSDSMEIIFYSDREGANDIYRFAADGSSRVALTGDSSSNSHPHWAPK